jgi:ferrous iron transport protein B
MIDAMPTGTPQKEASAGSLRVVLLGNPNTGKTTLFNRLCGLRHKTGNFPGTTQEARLGTLKADGRTVELIDLPGVYSLDLDQNEADIIRRVLDGTLAPGGEKAAAPDAACIVVDTMNLARNLALVGEVLRRRLPTVVALNMIDLARARGLHIDAAMLSEQLGCPVVACNARGGEGTTELARALSHASIPHRTPPGTRDGLEEWAESLCAQVATSHDSSRPQVHSPHADWTDRLDRILTHPAAGLLVFAAVMFGLFWSIFALAELPMTLIEVAFSRVAAWLQGALPPGVIRDFLAGGVVTGLQGVLIFLPQICLLFFLISILEDTGYLARAAFVMNRFLAPFGLSGHAFMPLLSSHACAIPGIMACRAIPDRRERLAAILSAPFMSCSARIPVYVLLTGLLFPGVPVKQALAFAACYLVGLAGGLATSLVARRTILRGPSRPMALELPTYKVPSLRTAALTTFDRAWSFVSNAGTNILAICVVLWWLSAYPKVEPPEEAASIRQMAAFIEEHGADESLIVRKDSATGEPVVVGTIPRDQRIADLRSRADAIEARHAIAHSFAGRLGRLLQPVFEPLGFDWKLTVGVLTSFAAREVFVGTMAVVVTGHGDVEDEGVRAALASATRDDGQTLIFNTPTNWSLLVYYVLAMQCLPTVAVTARESGGWKWGLLQMGWMCALAYVFGAAAHAIAARLA